MSSDVDPRPSDGGSPRVFWTFTLLGGAVMAFGVYGVLNPSGPGITPISLRSLLFWFGGAVILHDGVVAPLTLLIGRGVARIRPVVLRTPLQVGLALSAITTVIAIPLLRGYGRASQPGNDSVLPGNYISAWLTVLALIWAGAAVLAVVGARRQR